MKAVYSKREILSLFDRNADIELDDKKLISRKKFLYVVEYIVSKKVLDNTIKRKQRLTIDQVVNISSEYLDVLKEDILSSRHFKDYIESRILITLYLRENRFTYVDIGKKMGGKTHGSIIHYQKCGIRLIKDDSAFAKRYADLKYILDSKTDIDN